MAEMIHECDRCWEQFPAPIWHCPQCAEHWTHGTKRCDCGYRRPLHKRIKAIL